jgi:hypothetical protein
MGCIQAHPAPFCLRKVDQHCLPIDLSHCAWIAIAVLASKHPQKGLMFVGGRYRADVSVAEDRRGPASPAQSAGERQPRAAGNKYQGCASKPYQGVLPDASDFLLRCRPPAPMR